MGSTLINTDAACLLEAEQRWLLGLCSLTFELRGGRREGAWPAQRMMTVAGARAKCLAGDRPLQRRVRPHCGLAQRG